MIIMKISDQELKDCCEECFVAGLNDWSNFNTFYRKNIRSKFKDRSE